VRIKTSLRSSLSDETLEHLIRISEEGPQRYKSRKNSTKPRLCDNVNIPVIVKRFRDILGPKSHLAKKP